jgi:hypothetical protein
VCEDDAMAEYGNVTGQGTEAIAGGGRGSGGFDVGGMFSNLMDSISSLPMEMVLVAAAVVIVGGLVVSFRM